MDISYSDEQQFLRESIRGTIDREAPLARIREWVLDAEVPDHAPAFAIAERQGWTGIGLPEELGGQGGDLIELTILAEELGRGAVPADALYATLLTATARGTGDEPRGALVHPGAAPADTPVTDTSVSLVLGAQHAERFAVWDGDGIAVYSRDAVSITPRRHLDRTRALADVTITGVVADRVDANPVKMRGLAARAALIAAADALGASQRMLDLTTAYVAERVQFGVPVGSFQAVKHAASEMLVAIEGTRAIVQYAAWAVGAGESGAELDAWAAKSRSAQTAKLVADKALFLHGAVGYTWEHDLQLLFKRAKSDADLFGGAGVYDERIAAALELVADPALTS